MIVVIGWTYILASAISKHPNMYTYALLRTSRVHLPWVHVLFNNWFIVHLAWDNKKYDGLASLAPWAPIVSLAVQQLEWKPGSEATHKYNHNIQQLIALFDEVYK